MGLVEEAFSRLFPAAAFHFEARVTYSGKFKPYNATVRKVGNNLYFSFSRSWKGVSEEIVIGLIQHLLVKILKREKFFSVTLKSSRGKLTSLNMQLYDDFIKNISEVVVTSSSSDEKLEASFSRVSEKYFLGLADKPALRWGSDSFRKLASYDYHINTITVSRLFADAPQQLLDYLMHHELLHKKIKFSSSGNGRAIHHSSEFRRLEQNFAGSNNIEEELNAFIRNRHSRQWKRQWQRPRRPLDWRKLLLLQ